MTVIVAIALTVTTLIFFIKTLITAVMFPAVFIILIIIIFIDIISITFIINTDFRHVNKHQMFFCFFLKLRNTCLTLWYDYLLWKREIQKADIHQTAF